MSDVVDLLEDSPPPRVAEPVPPTDDQLRQAIKGLLMGKDLSTVSLKALRLDLEKGFHLAPGGLDSRKGDIRQLAQDLVVEAQNAPAPAPAAPAAAAPTTPVEPATKKRRTLAQAIPTAGDLPGAAPASPVKTKGPKRKAAPSAYSLWSLEHRSTVAEELEQELQRKPTFGEISKAVPERWKAVSEADKASYEEKAKLAKAEAMHDVPKEKPKKAEGSKKGKGKGKGKGKDGEEPMMSRAEFFAASPVINCAFQIPGVKAAESSMENLVARMFKSQGVGWFSSTKFQVPVGSKEVTVQAQVVMNVAGSKHWEDGEGLDEAMKTLEQRLEAGDGTKPQEVDSVAPEKSEVHQAVEHPETSAQQEAPAEAAGDASEADAATKEHVDEAPKSPSVEAADMEVGAKQEDVKMNDDAKVEPSEVEQPNDTAAKSEEDSKMEDAQAEPAEAEQPADDAPQEEVNHQAESPLEEASDPSAEVESKADADLQEKALVGGA